MTIPSPIAGLLEQRGACTSSEAIDALRQAEGLNAAAARKRLQRVGKSISRLSGINLPNRARVLYAPADYQSPRFFQGVEYALKSAGSVYGKTLDALSAREGLVPYDVFESITGSPAKRTGHLSPKTIFERLLQHAIVGEIEGAQLGRLVRVNPDICPAVASVARLRGRMLAERLCLLGLKEWARKTGLCSYDRVTIRGDTETPEFGTTRWDLVGPSYVSPLIDFDKGKRVLPGFIVADVCLGISLAPAAIEYFHHKVSHLRNARAKRFLAVLVGDFSPEAFRTRTRSQCLFLSPDTLFGKSVADALLTLARTVEHAGAVAAKNPEQLDVLLDTLGRIEGAKSALRGFAFELFAAHLLGKALRASIDINKGIFDPKTGLSAEIDVQAIIGEEEVKYVECKAYELRKPVERSEVADWLSRQVPRIASYHRAQARFQSHRLSFEIWSTTGFEADAISLLKEASTKSTRYEITWKSPDQISQFAKKHKLFQLAKAFHAKWVQEPILGSHK